MSERISRDGKPGESYSDKLLKVLPPELTATYFVLRTLSEASPMNLNLFLLIATLALCVMFFIVAEHLINMTKIRNKVLYITTFLIWVFAIDGVDFFMAVFDTNIDQEEVAKFGFSALAAIWSFGVPYFLQNKEER